MITGKDIHVAAEQATQPKGSPISDWNCLPEIARALYNEVAQKLNTAHVKPLQMLVSDMQIFIEEQCRWPSTVESDAIAEDVLNRAKALLPKEGNRP